MSWVGLPPTNGGILAIYKGPTSHRQDYEHFGRVEDRSMDDLKESLRNSGWEVQILPASFFGGFIQGLYT